MTVPHFTTVRTGGILEMKRMQKVGILYHPKKETAVPVVEKVRGFLEHLGVSTWTCSAWEVESARRMMDGTELVMTVGGDGTILRAVQTVAPYPVPITGINLGNLGFMTELRVDDIEEYLPQILAGNGWVDERSLIETVPPEGSGSESGRYYALNDIVLARGEIARIIRIEVSVNGEPLTMYRADGLIVATATGSTGYSLAAHGPILYPQSKDMLLVPVAPHLSSGYPLVLPEAAVIELKLGTFIPAALSIDGHINLTMNDADCVRIRHSSAVVRFLRIHPRNDFYRSLERKLKGKI